MRTYHIEGRVIIAENKTQAFKIYRSDTIDKRSDSTVYRLLNRDEKELPKVVEVIYLYNEKEDDLFVLFPKNTVRFKTYLAYSKVLGYHECVLSYAKSCLKPSVHHEGLDKLKAHINTKYPKNKVLPKSVLLFY